MNFSLMIFYIVFFFLVLFAHTIDNTIRSQLVQVSSSSWWWWWWALLLLIIIFTTQNYFKLKTSNDLCLLKHRAWSFDPLWWYTKREKAKETWSKNQWSKVSVFIFIISPSPSHSSSSFWWHFLDDLQCVIIIINTISHPFLPWKSSSLTELLFFLESMTGPRTNSWRFYFLSFSLSFSQSSVIVDFYRMILDFCDHVNLRVLQEKMSFFSKSFGKSLQFAPLAFLIIFY